MKAKVDLVIKLKFICTREEISVIYAHFESCGFLEGTKIVCKIWIKPTTII